MGFDCVFGIVQGKRQVEPSETAEQRVSVVPVYVCWCVLIENGLFLLQEEQETHKN